MKVYDFDLAQTLECGQCFNFEKISDTSEGVSEYAVCARERLLHIRQKICADGTAELSFLNASPEDVRGIWMPYFDLERDYGEIKRAVISADERLRPVVEKYHGIRILNQDFCETLISFIISQNKNIPQIKKCVKAICEYSGPFLGEIGKKKYYGFPDLSALSAMCEQDFRDLKCGFRAPYITDAVRKMNEGLSGERLASLSRREAKAELMSVHGVGDKVANCVLLFSLGFRESFPVDVWIERVMEELYFEGRKTPRPVIEAEGACRFGAFGGYAQQYLFMYARGK